MPSAQGVLQDLKQFSYRGPSMRAVVLASLKSSSVYMRSSLEPPCSGSSLHHPLLVAAPAYADRAAVTLFSDISRVPL